MASPTWLARQSAAFRLTVATSWLAPDLWRERQEQAIHSAVEAGVNWSEYIHLVVQRHRTPAISWAALRRVDGLSLPEKIGQQLQLEAKRSQLEATRNLLLLADVLGGLNRAGILVMPLKGPLLSQDLYGDPTLRHSRDLDLVCRASDLQAAFGILEQRGWLPEAFSSAFLHRFTKRQRQSFLRYEHHLVCSHGSGCTLELHWRELSEAPDVCHQRWLRSGTTTWQGRSYQAMEPNDLVRYLCVHGERHAWFRLKWLGDLARLHAAGEINWQQCIAGANDLGEQRALLGTRATLEELFRFGPVQGDGMEFSRLPEVLVRRNLMAMTAPRFPANGVARWIDAWRIRRFLAAPKPFKDSWLELGYRGQDYLILQLPDRWFWLYFWLRPFLFVWRHFFLKRTEKAGAALQ